MITGSKIKLPNKPNHISEHSPLPFDLYAGAITYAAPHAKAPNTHQPNPQDNRLQAGVGTMVGFSAVFTGNFVVTQAGNYTINVTSQDGFIFGANGATRVSGLNVNAPAASTMAPYAACSPWQRASTLHPDLYQ